MAENISVTLVLDDSQYTGKIDRAGKSVEDFGTKAKVASDKSKLGFDNVNHSAEALKAKMEMLQGVILGAGFLEFGKRALETADRVTDLSAATGVSIPELLNLREAFEASGGNAEKLGRVLGSLNDNMYAAREGSIAAQESLLKLGLSFSDIANLSTYDAMKVAAKSLAAIKDEVERGAVAFKLFGKEGRSIDWVKLNAEVQAGGADMGKYSESLKKAGDAHDKLAAAAEKLQIAFVDLLEKTGILDAINGLSNDMSKFEKAVTVAGIAFGIYFGVKAVEGVIGLALGVNKLTTALESLLVATKILEKGTVFGRIASLALVVGAAGAAYMGWDKLQDHFAEKDLERDKAAAESKKKLDKDKANAPKLRPVDPGWEKELVAIDAISEAYRRNNEENLRKINLQTQAIGLGEDQRQLEEQLSNARAESAKQQADLDQRIKETTANQQMLQNQKAATILALQTEKVQVKELADAYEVSLNKTIKLQQDKNRAVRFITTQYEDQIALDLRLQKITDETNKAGLSDRERKYADIASAARDSAKAEADAEEKRLGFNSDGTKIKLTAEARKAFEDAAAARAVTETAAAQRADEQATQFSTGWSRAYKQFAEDSANAASFAQQQFNTLTKGLEDAFITFAKTGKLSFKSLINDMVEQMLRNDFRKLMGGLLGGGGDGGGSLLGGIGKLFGLAGGGSVAMNRPVLVGEQGPEIFMPASNGSIIPNSQIGAGGTQQVNYYISAVDAKSFQALIARDPKFIHAVAEQGRMSMPTSRR